MCRTRRFAVRTGLQQPIFTAVGPKKIAVHTGLQQPIFSAVAPKKICCSYRCAVTHHQCTATRVKVCSDPPPMHCNIGYGEMHPPLLKAALNIRLTAAECHCNDTYGDLLFTQVCSDPPPMHCYTGYGEMHPPLLKAALNIRLTAA
ncbi:TPA: hypothetical protein ACH3X3_003301 [Trebouxia sp. C0006]